MLYIFLETNNLISVIHFPFVWDDHFPFLQKLIVLFFFLTKGRKEPVVGIFLWGNIFREILNKTKIVFYYTYFKNL